MSLWFIKSFASLPSQHFTHSYLLPLASARKVPYNPRQAAVYYCASVAIVGFFPSRLCPAGMPTLRKNPPPASFACAGTAGGTHLCQRRIVHLLAGVYRCPLSTRSILLLFRPRGVIGFFLPSLKQWLNPLRAILKTVVQGKYSRPPRNSLLFFWLHLSH